MNLPPSNNWRQKVMGAAGLLLLVALITQVAAWLLEPVIVPGLVAVALGGVYWIIFRLRS